LLASGKGLIEFGTYLAIPYVQHIRQTNVRPEQEAFDVYYFTGWMIEVNQALKDAITPVAIGGGSLRSMGKSRFGLITFEHGFCRAG
jgi:hypothetical protein